MLLIVSVDQVFTMIIYNLHEFTRFVSIEEVLLVAKDETDPNSKRHVLRNQSKQIQRTDLHKRKVQSLQKIATSFVIK